MIKSTTIRSFMSITLTIHHNIFLTYEERMALHQGEPQEVIGYSIPVWSNEQKTSEPVKEVFCRYYLLNSKNNFPVKIMDDGYEITIPEKIPKPVNDISNDVWRTMTDKEKAEYYKIKGNSVSSLNLLDVKDGGNGALMYREHNKFKQDHTIYNVIHFVHMAPIEILLGSMQGFKLEDNLLEQKQVEES